MKRDWTILIAHPDDELLWCLPILPDAKRIVCASSDKFNPGRKWCRERRLCLEEVGRRIGAEVICFDADSEFYRMPHRGGELLAFSRTLIGNLAAPVFTHNEWGEYGHLDHILINQIAQVSGLETWCADVAVEVDWIPIRPRAARPGTERMAGDRALFAELKAVYDRRRCWTWGMPVPKDYGVYRLC